MTVFLLSIDHPHGTDHWVCASEEVAKNKLFTFVSTWWKDELPEIDIPADADQAIETYFDAMSDRGESQESYFIEDLPLLTEAIAPPHK